MVVRNIAEEVMEQLRARARAERISVEELARRTLSATADEGARWSDFVRWAERNLEAQRRAHRPRGKREPSGARLIREDRER